MLTASVFLDSLQAIIYGVGTNSLKLPLPQSLPNGFLLLMKMCCDAKPRNRPSFSSILLHLSIASTDLVSQDPEVYKAQQLSWKKEVRSQLNQKLSSANQSVSEGGSVTTSDSSRSPVRRPRRHRVSDSSNNNYNPRGEDEEADDSLRRIAEMKHVEDIRALYEEKLERVNHLYAEMASLKAILQEQTRNKTK